MTDQKRLYAFNRKQIHDAEYRDEACITFEQQWINSEIAALNTEIQTLDLQQLKQSLQTLVDAEASDMPESVDYVTNHITHDEFRILVQEFAVDGLTEAQSFYYILPRLHLAAQMPMLRIMIDEFGSGNLPRAHTSLYIELLQELNMPSDIEFYIDRIDNDSYAFVNQFFWLTKRANDASYFAGAITYLETAIPYFFECYTQACLRLGIKAHHYYSEHQHIDIFHAREGQRLLQAMHNTNTLNPQKAWHGIQLASNITAQAFENAVEKSRRLKQVSFELTRGAA